MLAECFLTRAGNRESGRCSMNTFRKTDSCDVLSANIKGYLDKNEMSQKEAAEASGIKYTTFNSWVCKVSYPRLRNLQKLADLFHIRIEDLTEDRTDTGRRRKNYMTVAEIELLRAYEEDPEFRLYVENGLAAKKKKEIAALNLLLESYISERNCSDGLS